MSTVVRVGDLVYIEGRDLTQLRGEKKENLKPAKFECVGIVEQINKDELYIVLAHQKDLCGDEESTLHESFVIPLGRAVIKRYIVLATAKQLAKWRKSGKGKVLKLELDESKK